jgi:O-antigen/teichoic acid export membrane protein
MTVSRVKQPPAHDKAPNPSWDADPASAPLRGSQTDLTSGRKLTRNGILNIVGFCAPLLVALFTIPAIIREMGTDRFGLLTLAWAVIGYFSLFDFGINRALTKFVAEKLGSGDSQEIPALIWTALSTMLLLGLVVAGLLAILLPLLVRHGLAVPPALEKETLVAFYLLALSLPIVIVSVGFKGVLSAYQRFDLVNWVRVPMGIYFFLIPLPVVTWYANTLSAVIAALVFGRLVAVWVQFRFSVKVVPGLGAGFRFQRNLIGPLLSYGGWVTVSNVVGPLMIYVDRFFIGALMSASAVAFYATPNEMITKLWFLPWALLGVLFPAFSTSLAEDAARSASLFENSLKWLYLVMFPMVLVVILFANLGLDIWLGADFARESTVVLQWMAVGVFVYGMAQVPYALLQGAGRPDIIAKIHLIELPVYCLLLWHSLRWGGMQGAAMAWTLRMSVDGLAVYCFARRVLPVGTARMDRQLLVLAISLVAFYLASVLDRMVWKIGLTAVIFLLFAGFMWFILRADGRWRLIVKGK